MYILNVYIHTHIYIYIVFPQNIGRLSTKKTAKGQSVIPMTPIMSTQCTYGQCEHMNYWSFKHEQLANMLQTCTCCAYMLNMLNMFNRFTVYAIIGTVPWSSMFPFAESPELPPRPQALRPRRPRRPLRCASSLQWHIHIKKINGKNIGMGFGIRLGTWF